MMSQAASLDTSYTGANPLLALSTSIATTSDQSVDDQFHASALPRLSPASKSGATGVIFNTALERKKEALTELTLPLARSENTVSSTTELLAEWSGCVNSIHEGGVSFSATLTGIVGEGVAGFEEDATIPIDDVSEWDKELLYPGNFFRLCVVHEIQATGQPRRYTQVVFRRLPAYRRHDLEKAAELGHAISQNLRVE